MQTVIRVEKLSKTFNHNKALHAVDLTVQQGDMVALLGPSGSGKSTLLRHLSGLITCDKTPESHVELLGNTVQRAGRLASDIRKSRAQTGYIFQQFNFGQSPDGTGERADWRTRQHTVLAHLHALVLTFPEAGSSSGVDSRRYGTPPTSVSPPCPVDNSSASPSPAP